MSNFKVEFTLKQQTPIIHFQSEQLGATLRATELKPKFDRFIKHTLKNVNIDIYKKYQNIIEDEKIFPKDNTGSNAYKISIENNFINNIETPKAYVNKKETDKTAYQSPYFADANKSIFSTHEITVFIKSFNEDLLSLLNEVKDYVFLYENFGTRQSKGFGSFLRTDINNNEIKNIQNHYFNKIFKFTKSYKDYKTAFIGIDSFYKKLKMGINKPYEKSILFEYMCQKHSVGWEKKFIKDKFPEVIHGEHKPLVCKDTTNKEFRYIRALLGLAEHNEFRPSDGKKQVKIKSKEDIQRFKSPLTFKFINNEIYIMFDDSYKQILDKKFDFLLRGKHEELKTPENFDMYDFLNYVSNKTNLIKEVN